MIEAALARIAGFREDYLSSNAEAMA